jgi:hypothetical protein
MEGVVLKGRRKRRGSGGRRRRRIDMIDRTEGEDVWWNKKGVDVEDLCRC